MRKLNETFLKNLETGELSALLKCIKADTELDLQIRDNYVNIYYKGGNILKISPRSFYFDKMYFNDYNTIKSSEAKKDKVLLRQYKEKCKNLKKHIKSQPKEYFRQAKEIMDKWDIALKDVVRHNEKKAQQQIAIANKNDTDYVVLDLEYSVSRNSDFFYTGSLDKAIPRFDIIAIHNGQLVVIELKKGLGATGGLSGIKPHIDCFINSIGKDTTHLFVKEMKELLEQKKRIGILDKSLTIRDETPKFVFAFAEKDEKKNEFSRFYKLCLDAGGNDNIIYINNNHKLLKAMKPDFYYSEQEKQIKCLKNHRSSIFSDAKTHNKDYILCQRDSKKNLYSGIREDAIQYFKQYNISWWKCENKPDVPSGHLVSSQIHCLNHLFALRKDKYAVKQIIENATNMHFDEILTSIIDTKEDDSYISFEFAYNNDKLLGENDEGWKRGTLCTSIDALIRARKDNKVWLIPIEWKYTETYQGDDKTKNKRLERYASLIESSEQLKAPKDGIAHSIYFIEPHYELMRQTLLCEQLVRNGIADNFIHLIIIPAKHDELRTAVENEFIPMLNDTTKFKIVDTIDFLSPIKQNEKYEQLIKYLETRYWS